MIDTVVEQRASDAVPARFRVDDDHADPGEIGRVGSRGSRSCGYSIPFGEKATAWIVMKQPSPVARKLVPSGHLADGIRKLKIVFREWAYRRRKAHAGRECAFMSGQYRTSEAMRLDSKDCFTDSLPRTTKVKIPSAVPKGKLRQCNPAMIMQKM